MSVRSTVSFATERFQLEELRALTESTGMPVRLTPFVFASEAGNRPDDGPEIIRVGQVLVSLDQNQCVTYDIRVQHSWRVLGNRIADLDSAGHSPADVEVLKEAALFRTEAVMPRTAADESLEHTVVRHAKALCEMSRDQAVRIRERRYRLETQLAEESAGSANEAHVATVAGILRLNVMCGRIIDIANEAAREGLLSYINDRDAYHAYRKQRDPSLLSDVDPAEFSTRSWMRLHDAAIRQCENLSAEMGAESNILVNLLSAASSISSARDADAQTRLNTLVALISLGLGVPALVLALYGAQVLLPLQNQRQWIAFAPIMLSLLLAAVFAMKFAPTGVTRRIWIAAGLAVLGVLALLVLGALVVIEEPILG